MGKITHGAYIGGQEVPEHYIWREMLRRCREHHEYYETVKVHPHWLIYENFLEDMGPRPSPDHQLGRNDENGDYGPGNVSWVTRSQNQKSKRSTKRYASENAFVGTLVEVAEHLGISKELAYFRWKKWGTFRRGEKWVQLQKAG